MPEKQQGRDWLDALDVLGKFFSGVVIALLGLFFKSEFDETQQRIDDRELEISARRQFSDYLRLIVEAADDGRRADFIAALDVAAPDQAARIAGHFATNHDSEEVRRAAMRLLARVPNGRATLETIAKGGEEPFRDLAKNLLGAQSNTVLVRMSQVDDSARLLANDEEVLVTVNRDTGWVDIGGALNPGTNRLDFSLANGPYGGWGARLQLSSGSNQFDETWGENACPCNGKVLDLSVDVIVGAGGEVVSFAAGSPRFY